MSDRDLAEAIHHELISPASIDTALDNWRNCAHQGERQRMWRALASASASAIDRVLVRRLSEAARTGPWDVPSDEREACARHIEALACQLRDHGPKSPEGLLTAVAGAQVGALFDAAASLRGAP